VQAALMGLQFSVVREGATGFFRDRTVGFSENLTCLIGGRGAGKSAVIDAIRFLFMLPVEEIADPRLRDDVRNRQRKTLDGLESGPCCRSGPASSRYLVRKYIGDDSAPTRAYWEDGSDAGIDPASSTLTRIGLYGWSEIETLAKNPASSAISLMGSRPT